jgi:3-phenylpropionate/cinnamic acid dioxygenase small subunit
VSTTIPESGVTTQIEALQNRYITALDGKDIADWASCFSDREDASYICRSAENEANGWPIALMLDDCRARIEDRIMFITKIWVGTFQDYRTRHFVQQVSCERDGDLWKVRSHYSIEYTLDPNRSQTLSTGVYEDVIEFVDGAARFVSKKAIYDTTVLPQYIVYPF